jgi:cell division protein FtsA
VDGDIFYSSAIPIGGNHVTRDISIGLRTSYEESERLKINEAVATVGMVNDGDTFEVTSLGSVDSRELPNRILAEIVEARMHELFSMLKQEIMKSNYYNMLPAGIVLSGGGAQLKGAAELCKQVVGMPTRVGRPRDVGGVSEMLRSPIYATAVGLVQYGANYHNHRRQAAIESSPWGKLIRKIHEFFARITQD